MNITQETNDYFSTTEDFKQFTKEYKFEKNYNPLEHCNVNSGLKSTIKTTPNKIDTISKTIRNWFK